MSFSDHNHVNLLTAALLAYDVKDVVVCPGARNAPISHNLYALSDRLRLHPVTDERSAAFVALGIALRTQRPVAVCVTSGSALLGTLPAVAEAHMRHIPLLVISADRPRRLLGQQEGQTLPQEGALQPYARTFSLPERADSKEDAWHVQHLLHCALSELLCPSCGPCHVNVPIPEPLFGFSVPALPQVDPVGFAFGVAERPIPADVMELIARARVPLLLIGQRDAPSSGIVRSIEEGGKMLVLPELISGEAMSWRTRLLEDHPLPHGEYVIVHIGGNLVGKKLMQDLQSRDDISVVRIGEDNEIPDTFRHLRHVVRGDVDAALRQLSSALSENPHVRRLGQWLSEKRAENLSATLQERALTLLAREVHGRQDVASLHLANSTSVRLARNCFDGGGALRIFCNRGTNGIEGSVSTAVGYAIAEAALCGEKVREKPKTLLVTGDLSFFYDVNALWNVQLPENLRILLLNDGGGSIFRTLPGLADSPACQPLVAAAHHATAEGVCQSFGVEYLRAGTDAELAQGIEALLSSESGRPVLLEVIIADGLK